MTNNLDPTAAKAYVDKLDCDSRICPGHATGDGITTGAKPWDTLGMLQFAAMQEQAQVMRYDVEGDDGDE